MSKEDYFRRKVQLIEAVGALEQMLKVAESYKVLIAKKTDGYISAIVAQETPFMNTSFYLKKWFRTFVGIKDEAMLLINGELIRNYHFKVHERFVHTREQEQHYYTSKAELLGLSSCCVDGMNYEIRMIEKAYRKLMRGDEGDSINLLGDRVRDVEISVDSLCKYVDSYASILQKELRKRVDHVMSTTLEIKHKAENLTVSYKPNMTTCANFTFTCQEARKGSRKEALYSAIEEPKNSVSIQQQADAAPTANRAGKFRARMVVTDAVDDEYQQEAQRQRQERQEAERRRAELEAAKGPDFGFEFSIDREKRQAGAFELMAIPDTAEQVDTDVMATESRPDTPLPPSATSPAIDVSLQPAMLSTALNVLRDISTIKVKVVANNSTTSLDPTQLHKRKVPGTQVVAFSHALTRSVVQLYTSVAIVSPLNVAELRGDTNVPSVGAGTVSAVPAEEVLEEVCKQLWLSMPFAARKNQVYDASCGPGDGSAYLCIPVSVSINATKYTAGELLPLPSQKDLAEKRYQVKVDDRSTTALFTSSLCKWLSTLDEEEAFGAAKSQLFLLRPIIQCICDCLHDAAIVLDLGKLSHLALAAAAHVPVPRAEDQPHAQSYLEKLLQLAGAQSGRGWQISISESVQWGQHLRALITCASHFSAKAVGGLTAAVLSEFVSASHEIVANDSFCRLESVDMQHSGLLNYVDHSWELLLSVKGSTASAGGLLAAPAETEAPPEQPDSEPMDLDLDVLPDAAPRSSCGTATQVPSADLCGQFLLFILVRCSALRALDLSHCARSEQQAAVLGRGLAAALLARDAAGLAPLQTVAVRGLQEFPAVVRELLSQLKGSASGTQSDVSRLVGVCSLDVSGHAFVI